jgi:hypothetical protein
MPPADHFSQQSGAYKEFLLKSLIGSLKRHRRNS